MLYCILSLCRVLRHLGLVARQSLPQLKCNPPELRNDLFDILNMDAGPSAVLRVCRNRPCLALRGPWSGASPAVQPTPGLSVEGRLLAGRPLTSFGAAAFTRPVGTKTRYDARFEESWVVKFCRYSFSPFRGRAPVGFDKALPEGLNPAPWSGAPWPWAHCSGAARHASPTACRSTARPF